MLVDSLLDQNQICQGKEDQRWLLNGVTDAAAVRKLDGRKDPCL